MPTQARQKVWPRQIAANHSHDLSKRIGEVDVPTLITVGELDYLLPVSSSEELHRLLPGSELVIFERAGHLASMEASEEFNAVTLDFLRRVSKI